MLDTIIDTAQREVQKGEKLSQEVGDVTAVAVGGFHTTGNVLTWFLYYLTIYPKVQDKVASEIRTVLGDSDVDGDGIINAEDNDIDGDGIINEYDDDMDGDGIDNDSDDSETGYLSIKVISPYGSLQLSPNPSNGEFSVKFPDSQNYFKGSFLVLNSRGEIVFQNQLQLNNNEAFLFNNLNLASGIYFVRLINEGGEFIYDKRIEIIK